MATAIKSKLSDDEKKKVKKLSSLENTSRKGVVKTTSTINSPIKYTKVDESKSQTTTADTIKAQADDYFNRVLNTTGATEQKANSDDGGLSADIRKVQNTKSGTLSTMPHIEDNYSGSQIYSNPKTLDELFINLDGINKSFEGKSDKDYYEDLLPEVKESLGLQKLEAVEIDDAKIRKQVEDILSGEYNLKKQSAEKSTAREIESEKQSQLDLINSAEANKKEITAIYDEAKIQSSNTSLKRGLARSSIAVLSLDGLEKQKAEELSNLATSLTEALDESEAEIKDLRNELQLALENLDIEYAIEINESIKKEVNSLYEKQKEVIQFNNNVDKLEADYQSKRNSLLQERAKMEESLAEEYKGVAEREKSNDITSAVLKYFSGMSKAEAIKQLTTDSRFVDYLGSSFYDVYYKLMRG